MRNRLMSLGISLIIAAVISLSLVSCESSTSSDPLSAKIVIPGDEYVWGDSLLVSISSSGGTVASAVFFVDGSSELFDEEAPFEFWWDLKDFDYGSHTLQAKVFFSDDKFLETDNRIVVHMPFPFYDEFLADFDGITERDANGNLVGEVDQSDWKLTELSQTDSRETFVLSLNIGASDRKVYLNWRTAYEYNHDGFYLLRGTSEDAYEQDRAIQLNPYPLTGEWNEDEYTYYEFVDSLNIEYLTYYYWLEAIDPVSENEVFGPWSITVEEDQQWSSQFNPPYPNPAQQSTTCHFSLEKECLLSVILIDDEATIIGEVMSEASLSAGEHSFSLDCSEMDVGLFRCVYYISDNETEWIGYGDIRHGADE